MSNQIDDQNSFVDYYSLLGVPPHVNTGDLRKAYFEQAKQKHPDRGGSVAQMDVLNKAYTTLGDRKSRSSYNKLHQFHTGTESSAYTVSGMSHLQDIAAMSEDEIDDFVNTVFEEYALKPAEKNKNRFSKKISLKNLKKFKT